MFNAGLIRLGAQGIAAVGLLTWAAACSDPVTTGLPPAPPPSVIDFAGSYTVNHTFEASAVSRSAGCPGSAILSSEFGFQFDGTIGIQAIGGCQQLGAHNGQILGSIREAAISFSVSGFPDPFAVIGCQTIGGDPAFSGTFSTRRLQDEVFRVITFRGTRRMRARCDGAEVDVQWEIRGARE